MPSSDPLTALEKYIHTRCIYFLHMLWKMKSWPASIAEIENQLDSKKFGLNGSYEQAFVMGSNSLAFSSMPSSYDFHFCNGIFTKSDRQRNGHSLWQGNKRSHSSICHSLNIQGYLFTEGTIGDVFVLWRMALIKSTMVPRYYYFQTATTAKAANMLFHL